MTQNIPIIMCTSKNQQTDRIWGLRRARATTSSSGQGDELLKKSPRSINETTLQ